MDIEFIIYILLILVILNLAFTFYVYCQKPTISLEGFDVSASAEALENLASILDSGNMKVTNLTVTGKLTGNEIEVNNKLNVKGRTVAKDVHADNVQVGGVKIEKHPKGYLKIPAPVEINNALGSNHNVGKPGIIVGNVISTTSLLDTTGHKKGYQPCIDYGISVLAEANKYGLANGSWVSGIGRDYIWGDPDRGGGQRWFAKKAQTPGGNAHRGGGYDFRAFYTNNTPLSPWLGPWYKADGTVKT
jgi:hypothetical protein